MMKYIPIWISEKNQTFVIIDFGKIKTLSGMSYTPDQGRYPYGLAKNYTIYISNDAKKWTTIKKGEFFNIKNNRIAQKILFDKNIRGQYIKFEANQLVNKTSKLVISELDFF
ncbi:MAG: discoidin domain-containing protein [Chitinophagaceae bacterium]